MRKNKLWFYFFVLFVVLVSCQKKYISPEQKLIHRFLPNHADRFIFETIPQENGKDIFELVTQNENILIRGSSPTARIRGLNWYLKYYCYASTSHCGDQLNLPNPLPTLKEPVRIATPYQYRYYLNYCTFNYSMSFWDWEQWEREIDWMAMNGINMPLAILGTEKVWQNTLRRFQFSEEEISNFICGPTFTAWWLMNNLEGWGGPVSQGWIDQQADLQKMVLKRMREFGMKPILQGFYGMVPFQSIQKFPDADIWDSGLWVDFQRPAFINPTDSLFTKMAKVYYEEVEKLYGKVDFFGGDPFHEHEDTDDFDLSQAGQAVQDAMLTHNPDAVWVLQGWWSNPKDEMLARLDKGHTLVLDLWSEYNPNWEKRKAYGGQNWIWTVLSNFGDKVGPFGRLQEVCTSPFDALNSPYGNTLKGMGAIMEGISSNPVLYDLVYEVPWMESPPNLSQWINDFVFARYGKNLEATQKAWAILLETVYDPPRDQEQASESIFCARPSWDGSRVNMWGSTRVWYGPARLEEACQLLLSCADELGDVDSYQYDLVDITRQVLSNRGLSVFYQMKSAFMEGDFQSFLKTSDEFIQLIKDQDQLLGTRKEFLLGRWIKDARTNATNPKEQKLFEWNARTLITLWGDKKPSEELHEYSHREWSGLLKGFYLPRWKLFIESQKQILQNEETNIIDWFDWENEWTRQNDFYPENPQNHPIQVSDEICKKYLSN